MGWDVQGAGHEIPLLVGKKRMCILYRVWTVDAFWNIENVVTGTLHTHNFSKLILFMTD